MDDVTGVARLVLAGVFLVAGWAKLSDRPATRTAVVDLGVPQALSKPVGLLLPLAELAVAVGLLISAAARTAAIGALVLLGLFILAITVSLARGRRPNCNCFGQVHSAPIGASTLVRNLLLAAAAAVIVGNAPGSFVSSWVDRATLAAWIVFAAAIVMAILLWFVLNLTAQHGRLLERIEAIENAVGIEPEHAHEHVHANGLPVGDPAPLFELPSVPSNETVSLDALLDHGLPVLLIFTSTGCGSCDLVMPDVARWQTEHADTLTIAVLGDSDREANTAKAQEFGLSRVLLQNEHEVATAYQYVGTPSAVVVSAAGVVGSALVAGGDDIRALAEQAAAGELPSQRWVPVDMSAGDDQVGLAVGEEAPEISLPDLQGTTVSSNDYRGKPAIVLFWRQTCGFCAGMLEELRAWDNRRTERSPQLLVVSTGTPEEHADMGLTSTVVLDQTAAAMNAYGANGTPMAVLIDADGRIASSVAIGAVEVMNLARSDAATAAARS